jgi:hypothetical protein
VANVVQQGGEPREGYVMLFDLSEFTALGQQGERASREMVGAERVLESRVCRARVDEKGMAELPDVPQALNRLAVEQGQRLSINADVVP